MTDLDLVKALRCLEQNVNQRYEECNKHDKYCDGCPFYVETTEIGDFETQAEYVVGLAASRLEALIKEET